MNRIYNSWLAYPVAAVILAVGLLAMWLALR